MRQAGGQIDASSGGGSVSWAPAGGAPQVNVAMPEDIASDQAHLMHVDPKYQEQLDALGAEVASKQGKLVQLDPESQAQIDEWTNAQIGQSRQSYNDNRADMLARLFAGGTNQSTIAGDIGGRLLDNQALTEGTLKGQGADRALNLRQFLTDDQRQALGLRAQIAQGSQDAALKEPGHQRRSV
jgi:hypothetical protein